jgi:hypothetical protein
MGVGETLLLLLVFETMRVENFGMPFPKLDHLCFMEFSQRVSTLATRPRCIYIAFSGARDGNVLDPW